MDLQKQEQGETTGGTSNYIFSFLIIVIVIIFIGVGVFVGYILGQNKSNQNNDQNINQLVTPGLNPSGILFNDASQQSSGTAANWTIYSDVNFSVKYPTNWLIKKGFSSQTDTIVYDPASIKQVTQNGQQSRIPTAYVDILSVGAATQSAQQIFDNANQQASNSAMKDEQSPTLGQNQVLFNTGKSSGNTVLWTQDGMLAQFATSMQHLNDSSTENKILQTFQFIK